MIAGVGPVLGEGIIGWIIYYNREYEREYRDGASLSLGEAFTKVAEPYTLLKPFPRVAVLTDAGTVSAAEAVTVFFRARPDTRSSGTATCGHHHLQQGFPFGWGGNSALGDCAERRPDEKDIQRSHQSRRAHRGSRGCHQSGGRVAAERALTCLWVKSKAAMRSVDN